MKNLGKVSRGWLAEIGILNLTDLKRCGALTAYRMIRERHPRRASLNLLWALAGAIEEIHWLELDEATRKALREQFGKTP